MTIESSEGRRATNEWVFELEKNQPERFGKIGRPPTKEEQSAWLEAASERRSELMAAKIRYLRSGLKSHFLRYIDLRRACGFIDGCPVPKWLWSAGKT